MIITNLKELRTPCLPISSQDEVDSTVRILEESFSKLRGYGLAANQIGINKQVAIVRMEKCSLNLVNPLIVDKENKFMFQGETCFSFPGLRLDTDRYMDLVVESGLEGNRQRFIFTGFEAVVIQHEIDHLQGRTILDRKHRRRK